MPTTRRRRILLDAEHRADPRVASACGTRWPRCRRTAATSPAPRSAAPRGSGIALPLAVDEQRQEFEQRRAPDVARAVDYPAAPARSARAMRAASAPASRRHRAHRRAPAAALASALATAARAASPVAAPGRRPIDHRQIQLVDHQRLARQPRAVLRAASAAAKPAARRVARLRERSRRRMTWVHSATWARDVAPQHIQPLVPVVELLIVRALEARAAEPKHLHVVTACGPDDVSARRARV